MLGRILFLCALTALGVGCVERYDFKYVSDDLAAMEDVDASGGDALEPLSDQTGDDVCVPDCAGKICGPDGCDGSCGPCGIGYHCDQDTQESCSAVCKDLCDGLECGPAGLDDECDCGACDDQEACTNDYCGAGTCIYDPLDEECDDGDLCTVGDWCVEGACKATDKDCDDGNPCTDDFCNDDGNCDYSNNTSSCDDDDLCTVSDICSGGSCTGTDKDCDDGNDCTLDSCGDNGVCDHDPVAMNGEDCDDGNPCTDDLCSGGACAGTPKPIEDLVALECICAQDADCAQFEDGDLCNGTLICDKHDEGDEEGICKVDAGTVLTCTDEIECTTNACEPLSGCVITPDHASCDDGDGCTDDTCDGALGCLNVDNTAACDDGDACTENDVCAEGVCAGPDETDCDDQVDCTTDTCDPETGCAHAPDAEACPAPPECQVAICHPTDGCQQEDADDDTPCTAGACLDGACHVTGEGLSCGEIFDCVKECGPQEPDCATQCVDAGSDEAKDLFAEVIACLDATCGAPPDDPGCPIEAETGACASEVTLCEGGCVPDCDGKDCGDNGCDGSCGDCDVGEDCQDGACVEAAGEASCGEIRDCTQDCEAGPGGADCRDACVATGDPDAQDLYDAILQCVFVECGSPPTPGCIPTAEVGVCADEVSACEADCDPETCEDLGKECGDWNDGCGGTTGDCGLCDEFDNSSCASDGSCVCNPDDCVGLGKVCGEDGCGGSCGECGGATACFDGACLQSVWLDTSSGLEWRTVPMEQPKTWSGAEYYCDQLLSDGGGWRLPTIGELRSLIRGCPTTEPDGACNIEEGICLTAWCVDEIACWGCTPNEGPADGCYWPDEIQGTCEAYWSSSADSDDAAKAWYIHFSQTYMTSFDVSYGGLVRCVRDGQ